MFLLFNLVQVRRRKWKKEQVTTEEQFEKGFQAVEKFVQQYAGAFGPKLMSNVFLLKLAWEGRKIEVQLRRKRGQTSMRDFVN